jgi:peptidase E
MRDGISRGSIACLNGKLHVIEARGGKTVQLLQGLTDTGSDQVGVEANFRAMSRNGLDVGAYCWLPAREMDVKYPERGSFTKNTAPRCGVELRRATLKLDRI